MKKSFMFVAVAAAGMLASCSSESLTSSDPKIEPTQEELVPIEISVASPSARAITRGTGTVGGVEDGSGTALNNDGTETGTPKANIWAGQKVRVYMFNKGTLDVAQSNGADLFNNAEMDTPAATDNTASGLAHYVDPNSTRYLVKYYPLTGAYDFWGYRIDDATAAPATPVISDGKLSLGITVNGTQDVLGAKTKSLTQDDLPGTITVNDLYSAKAARQSIQPELEFKHLMTRLTFEAYPGNDNAKTVYVTGIKVRALNAYDPENASETEYNTPVGTLDIAGTPANTFEQKITWETAASDAAPAQFVLMKRAAGDTYDNQNLVDLIDTSNPDWTANGAIAMNLSATDGTVKAPIGDAIIAPDAQAYEIEIDLVQKVAKYEDSQLAEADDWENYQFNSIKTVVKLDNGATRFLPGYTYDFIFKVYGLEKIQVTTTLEPWIWGENQEIVTE